MRHLRSILYALVLAPAVWVLCGVGEARAATGWLMLAGVAYAFLLLAPISPAGPLLAGAVFLALSGWALFLPDLYAAALPNADLSEPGHALAALLAIPLLATALNWRRWADHEPFQLPFLGTIGRTTAPTHTPYPYPQGPPSEGDEPTTLFPAQPHPNYQPAAFHQPPAAPPAPSPAAPSSAASPHAAPAPSRAASAPSAEDSPQRPTGSGVRPFVTANRHESTEPFNPFDEPTTSTTPATGQDADKPTATAASSATAPADVGVDARSTSAKAEDPEEPTAVITGEEPTAGHPDRIFVTHPNGISEEHSADELTASHQTTEPIAAEDATAPTSTGDSATLAPETKASSGTTSEETTDPDADEPTVAVDDKETVAPVAAPTDPDGEKTQVLRLPRDREVGAGPTRDFRGGGKTYLEGPGEQTQVIYLLEPANAQHAAQQAAKARAVEQEIRDQAAQDRARQAFRDRAALERAKQAFDERAAAEARSVGEETQIIKLPIRRDDEAQGGGEDTAPARGDGDRTTGLATPTGSDDEKTTALPLRPDDAATTALSTPGNNDKTTSLTTPGTGDETTILATPGSGDETTALSTPGRDEKSSTPGRDEKSSTPASDEKTTLLPRADDGGDENTTLLRHATVMPQPVGGLDGERRSRSIVDQERPDPAADPTTRLIPAQRDPERGPEQDPRQGREQDRTQDRKQGREQDRDREQDQDRDPERRREMRPRSLMDSLMDIERPADEDDR